MKRKNNTLLSLVLPAVLCTALWGSAAPCVKKGYELFGIAAGDSFSQLVFAGWRFTLAGVLVLLVAAVGVVLMLLPGGKQTQSAQAETDTRGTYSLEETERRMETLLGKISGTGQLSLMLTVQSGAELELAEDTDADERGQRRETVTLGRGSGTQDVVVTRERYPSYQGAVVVCEGAGDAAVRLALTEAVSALTGLSADRISIVQWKS